MYLVDTCVLSEARRGAPEAVAWLRAVDPDSVFVGATTVGEIMQGVALTRWLADLRTLYADRILPAT
jgi:predicted nucleic acid-binding protein